MSLFNILTLRPIYRELKLIRKALEKLADIDLTTSDSDRKKAGKNYELISNSTSKQVDEDEIESIKSPFTYNGQKVLVRFPMPQFAADSFLFEEEERPMNEVVSSQPDTDVSAIIANDELLKVAVKSNGDKDEFEKNVESSRRLRSMIEKIEIDEASEEFRDDDNEQ